MMPLSMVGTGEENTIQRIGGKEETKKLYQKMLIGGENEDIEGSSLRTDRKGN